MYPIGDTKNSRSLQELLDQRLCTPLQAEGMGGAQKNTVSPEWKNAAASVIYEDPPVEIKRTAT